MSLPFVSLSLEDHGDAHTGGKTRDERQRDSYLKKRLEGLRKANAKAAKEKEAVRKQEEQAAKKVLKQKEAVQKQEEQAAKKLLKQLDPPSRRSKPRKEKAIPTPSPAPASVPDLFVESDEDEDRRPVAGAGEASQPPPVEEADNGYDSWGGWTDDDEEEAPREVGPFARAFLEAKAKKEKEDKEAELRRKVEKAREAQRQQEREAQRQLERQARQNDKLPDRDDELERMLDMFNRAKPAP
jgi:hypothetical protein